MIATASSVAAHHDSYEDLEAGMDVPVTEDAVRALGTRMLREHKTVTKTLLTVARFEREEDDEEVDDE